MTVDMLAATFIWPEEVLIGRTRIGHDLDPITADDAPGPDTGSELDPAPFWAALVRRFRADPLSRTVDPR